MQPISKLVSSPCVGLCSTTYGDYVCRGCMRTSTQISAWPASDETRKRALVDSLDAIMQSVMPDYFAILDETALKHALARNAVPIDPGRSPWAWLHKLLVRQINTIRDPSEIGVQLKQEGDIFSLFQRCRETMYRLACGAAK